MAASLTWAGDLTFTAVERHAADHARRPRRRRPIAGPGARVRHRRLHGDGRRRHPPQRATSRSALDVAFVGDRARVAAASLHPRHTHVRRPRRACRRRGRAARSRCRAKNTARSRTRFAADIAFTTDSRSALTAASAVAAGGCSISTGCAASRSSRWCWRTSPIRGRATPIGTSEPFYTLLVHRRRRVAAVPVSRRRRHGDVGGVEGADGEGSHRAGAALARRRGLGDLRARPGLSPAGAAARLRARSTTCSRSTCSTRWACRWSPHHASGNAAPTRPDASRMFALLDRRDRDGHATRARDAWLAPLPDPLEAYLRPAGGLRGVSAFPWAGFLFAGVLVGDLVDAVRACADGQSCCRRARGRRRAAGHLARVARVVPTGHLPNGATSGTIRRRSSSSASGWSTLLVPIAWIVRAAAALRCSPAARDARPLVAVRLLDPRRDGLRRDRRAAQAHSCRCGRSLAGTALLTVCCCMDWCC